MRKPPARYVMIVLLSFGMANIFSMRTNMSVAIVAMVNKSNTQDVNRTWSDLACPELVTITENQSTSYKKKVADGGEMYDWDTETQAQILGSLYYGYFATAFFGGILSQKVSAKWLFGLAVFGTSILNLLTPAAATLGATPVIVLRSIQGCVQCAAVPARAILISNWMPIMERSRAMTLTASGVLLGTTFGFALSGVLVDSVTFGGWPAAFYIFGILTGISYTFGSLSAILGPYAVGQFTKTGHTVENWTWVFIMLASVYIFAATVFNFFGTAEIQPWDSPSAQKSGENCEVDRSKEIATSNFHKKTVTTKL